MHLDWEAICAAILHDVVEDTEASLEEIAEKFGEDTLPPRGISIGD